MLFSFENFVLKEKVKNFLFGKLFTLKFYKSFPFWKTFCISLDHELTFE